MPATDVPQGLGSFRNCMSARVTIWSQVVSVVGLVVPRLARVVGP